MNSTTIVITVILLGIINPAISMADGQQSTLPATPQSQSTSSTEVTQNVSYYKDVKHNGYWWYEVTKEDHSNSDTVKNPKDTKHFIPKLSDYSREQLWTMYPDDFQGLITAFLNKAVQTPTEQNVAEYYTMMNIARLRANAFTNVATLVQQKHPELTVQKDYPANAPGNNAKTLLQDRERTDLINNSSSDFAIVYFYKPDCQFCQAQSGILNHFIHKYNWQIKRVNIYENPDFADNFNVSTVPYLLLIYKNSSDSIPIGVGVTALDEIEQKLYSGIRLLTGVITADEFNMYEYQRGGGFDPHMYSGTNKTEAAHD